MKTVKKSRAKRFKKKADPVKTLAEIEGLDEGKGLRLAWLKFIEAYISNGGNGTRAYQVAYPGTSDDTAGTNAARLLGNARIRAELNNKLGAQEVTEEFIVDGLKTIAVKYRGAKTIMAAVKSYEILSKIKGMLVDTKKIAFTGDNPAVFLPVYNAKEKEEFDKIKKDKQRIVE
jgi:hypothetical protein